MFLGSFHNFIKFGLHFDFLKICFVGPIGPYASVFALLTGIWIGLGGIFQFGYVIYVTCTETPDGPFKMLPIAIQTLVFVTAPILLSPVILSLYGAYIAATKYDQNAIKQIQVVISSLKVAEMMLESIPQLATQWAAIGLLIMSGRPQSVSLLQFIPIATCTLVIIAAKLKFISMRREGNFVSHNYPAIASLVPLGFVLLLALKIGTIGVLATFYSFTSISNDSPYLSISAFVINILTAISSFLIVIAPFTHKYFIVSRNLYYLLLAMASAIINTWMAADPPGGEKKSL